MNVKIDWIIDLMILPYIWLYDRFVSLVWWMVKYIYALKHYIARNITSKWLNSPLFSNEIRLLYLIYINIFIYFKYLYIQDVAFTFLSAQSMPDTIILCHNSTDPIKIISIWITSHTIPSNINLYTWKYIELNFGTV